MTSLLQRPPARVAGRPAIRLGPTSAVWRPRAVLVTAGLLALLLLALAVNISRGDFPIPLGDVLTALSGAVSAPTGSSWWTCACPARSPGCWWASPSGCPGP